MGVKTITLDLEAYELLARHKGPKQSFSQVIKHKFKTGRTAADLLAALAAVKLPEATLDAIEQGVAARRRDFTRQVKL
jgi:predicted CopG family antitoxin